MPHYIGTRYMTYPQAQPDIQMVYRRGPVLVAPKMYLII